VTSDLRERRAKTVMGERKTVSSDIGVKEKIVTVVIDLLVEFAQ
jgi:hypothetical protein